MARRRRRFYGEEVTGNKAIRAGRLVLINGSEEFDVSPVLGFSKGKLKFEFYSGQWHMNCSYEVYAGYGVSHGCCYGTSGNEKCLETLKEIKTGITKKIKGLDEVNKRLDDMIKKIELDS